jgi:hypothetical protein
MRTPGAIARLAAVGADAGKAFPGVLSAHLILPAAAAVPPSAESRPSVWLDTDGRVHEKLHAKDRTLVLVRPDRYIGYRCQPADGDALTAYLGRYLVRSG